MSQAAGSRGGSDGYKRRMRVRRGSGYYAEDDKDHYLQMRKQSGETRQAKLDKKVLIAVADSLKDDGVVDIEEAKEVFVHLADGRGNTSELTCNERWTLRYCIGEFEWTEEAHNFILSECKKIQKITDAHSKEITDPIELQRTFEGPNARELGLDGAPKFKVGQEVELHSLRKAVELNGRRCTIIDYDAALGRYWIEIPNEPLRRVVEDNLKLAELETDEPASKRARVEAAAVEPESSTIPVDGMLLDKAILAACRRALRDGAERSDGTKIIDALAAIEVFKAVSDDDVVTLTERWTMRFVLSAFPFTRAAHNFLVEALARDKLRHNNKMAT